MIQSIRGRQPALFVLALFTALLAPAVNADSEARILVSGQGRAALAPDMALLTLVVTREAESARAALDANSQAMTEVLAAMRDEGIADADLQTSDFSIQPRYNQPPRHAGGERPAPRIVGYTVRNSLTVRVRDIARTGAILDRSVTLGVNEGGRVQFANADPSGALEQARTAAVRDALSRARTLAEAAGVRTGAILEISEQSRSSRPVPMMRAAMEMDAAGSVPIAAGETSYTVTVDLTLAIEQ